MDLAEFNRIFKEIILSKHGRDIDFGRIEIGLNHLREGASISYADLQIIGDDRYWPAPRERHTVCLHAEGGGEAQVDCHRLRDGLPARGHRPPALP